VLKAPEPKQASVTETLQHGAALLPAFVTPRLLRIQDAAKYLSATTWQIETLLRENTIPSFVLGKRRVVDRLELDRYVQRWNAEVKARLNGNLACPTVSDEIKIARFEPGGSKQG